MAFQVTILTPEEMSRLRKQEKITQQQMCLIMGLSPNSYMVIRRFERHEQDIVTYPAWKFLQEYMAKHKITIK